MTTPSPPPSIDDNPVLLERFAVSRRIALEWTALSLVGFVASIVGFGGLYSALTGHGSGFSVTLEAGRGLESFAFGVLALGSVLGVIVAHELVHGAAMRYFGAEPTYGFGVAQSVLPYAYATTDEPFARDQFLVVALAPLVVLTAALFGLAVALRQPFFLLPLAVNAGGAVGDLWMARLLLRYPKTVRVVDDVTAFEVYGSGADDRPVEAARGALRALRALLVGFGAAASVAVVAMLFGGVLFELLGVASFAVGPPESAWSVYRFERGPDGVRSQVGLLGVIGASIAFGVGYAVLTRP
ncbi:DUF3267 domain-containing protein [Haloferacaceae archaeon DSL9]